MRTQLSVNGINGNYAAYFLKKNRLLSSSKIEQISYDQASVVIANYIHGFFTCLRMNFRTVVMLDEERNGRRYISFTRLSLRRTINSFACFNILFNQICSRTEYKGHTLENVFWRLGEDVISKVN